MFLKDPISRLTQNFYPFGLGKITCERRKILVIKSEIAVAGVYRLYINARIVNDKKKGGKDIYDLPYL